MWRKLSSHTSACCLVFITVKLLNNNIQNTINSLNLSLKHISCACVEWSSSLSQSCVNEISGLFSRRAQRLVHKLNYTSVNYPLNRLQELALFISLNIPTLGFGLSLTATGIALKSRTADYVLKTFLVCKLLSWALSLSETERTESSWNKSFLFIFKQYFEYLDLKYLLRQRRFGRHTFQSLKLKILSLNYTNFTKKIVNTSQYFLWKVLTFW